MTAKPPSPRPASVPPASGRPPPGPRRLIEVTVVLLERALPSSSVAPIEIFGATGVLWPMIHGQPPAPRFRVRTGNRAATLEQAKADFQAA